jgi:hypothetical protein
MRRVVIAKVGDRGARRQHEDHLAMSDTLWQSLPGTRSTWSMLPFFITRARERRIN